MEKVNRSPIQHLILESLKVSKPPCEKDKNVCKLYQKCAAEKLSCEAFRTYITRNSWKIEEIGKIIRPFK